MNQLVPNDGVENQFGCVGMIEDGVQRYDSMRTARLMRDLREGSLAFNPQFYPKIWAQGEVIYGAITQSLEVRIE